MSVLPVRDLAYTAAAREAAAKLSDSRSVCLSRFVVPGGDAGA